jgi:hypothetical protein
MYNIPRGFGCVKNFIEKISTFFNFLLDKLGLRGIIVIVSLGPRPMLIEGYPSSATERWIYGPKTQEQTV